MLVQVLVFAHVIVFNFFSCVALMKVMIRNKFSTCCLLEVVSLI